MTIAKNIIEQLSPIVEDASFGSNDPDMMTATIKGAVDKIAKIQFKSDDDKKNYLDRVANKFGRPVADLINQFLGKSPNSITYPDKTDDTVNVLVKNLNGILGIVP